MRLFNTGDGEGGEELGVWDPGVPLCHDAAQAGHGPVPGTRGVSGPGEAWLWMWPDPALHRDTSADIGCNLLVTQGVNHNWRMLNPKDLLRHYASLQTWDNRTSHLSRTLLESFPAEFEKMQEYRPTSSATISPPTLLEDPLELTRCCESRAIILALIKSNSKYYWHVLSFFVEKCTATVY